MDASSPTTPLRTPSALERGTAEVSSCALARSGSKTAKEVKSVLATSKRLSKADSDLLDLLEQWDQNGDGQYSTEEVLVIAQRFRQKELQVRNLSRILCTGSFFVVVLLVGVLIVTMQANELSKDTRPNEEGVLTTNAHRIVGVANIYQTATLDVLPNMSDAELAQLEFVSFDVDGEHNMFKVAGAVRRSAAADSDDMSRPVLDVYFDGGYITKLSFGEDVEIVYQNGTSTALRSGRRLRSSSSRPPWSHFGAVGISGRWDADKVTVAASPWSHVVR